LLTFDKSNCEKPGTFEHLAWGYWKQFKQLEPNEMGGTRENDFIYNPVGVLAASQVRGSYYRANRPGLLFGPIVLSFAVPMMLASGMVKLFGEESMWGFALSIPIFAILVPLGFITGLRAVRSNRKNLRDAIQALEPIRQYVAALQDMGIIVQLEFTQLKSKATGAGTAPSNIVPNEAAA
jgi:hypothetical protein